METFKEVTFVNPCKYCLTKAICQRRCRDLTNYIDTNEVTFCITVMLIMMSIVIASIILSWDISLLRYTLLISIMLSYFFSIRYFIVNEADQDIMNKKYELMLVLAISPWGITISYLIEKFNIDTYIDAFSKRHAKHLKE